MFFSRAAAATAVKPRLLAFFPHFCKCLFSLSLRAHFFSWKNEHVWRIGYNTVHSLFYLFRLHAVRWRIKMNTMLFWTTYKAEAIYCYLMNDIQWHLKPLKCLVSIPFREQLLNSRFRAFATFSSLCFISRHILLWMNALIGVPFFLPGSSYETETFKNEIDLYIHQPSSLVV